MPAFLVFLLAARRTQQPPESNYMLIVALRLATRAWKIPVRFQTARPRFGFQNRITHRVRPHQNAKENTPNTARIEHDKALARVMLSLLKDDTEIYKQFVQNESFKRFVADMVFTLTNE